MRKAPPKFIFAWVVLLVLLILLYVYNRREGLQDYGNCSDNPNMKKINKKGSNCYGWCPYSNEYKKSKKGSECIMYPFGYCKNIPGRPMLDEEGSNCQKDLSKIPYKLCPDNYALKSMESRGKVDSNCFGWCDQKRKAYKWPWETCEAKPYVPMYLAPQITASTVQ